MNTLQTIPLEIREMIYSYVLSSNNTTSPPQNMIPISAQNARHRHDLVDKAATSRADRLAHKEKHKCDVLVENARVQHVSLYGSAGDNNDYDTKLPPHARELPEGIAYVGFMKDYYCSIEMRLRREAESAEAVTKAIPIPLDMSLLATCQQIRDELNHYIRRKSTVRIKLGVLDAFFTER